jgi:hypothetical protein
MTTTALGEEGFRWWVGVVEDREDPKQLGRVRVRIYNVHPFTSSGGPDISLVPTEHLPWATSLNSVISSGIYSEVLKDGVGLSPVGLAVGSHVVGFFADSNECQLPIIMGSFAGLSGSDEKNELPNSSIGKNTVGSVKNNTKVGASSPFAGEPQSPFNPKYPYNKSFRSESGHLIEIDDSPGNERVHVFHKTGTYVEIDKNGQTVIKSVSNRYDVTVGSNEVYVGGNVNVKVKGNVNMFVDGTYTVESKGNMKFKAPRIDLNDPV